MNTRPWFGTRIFNLKTPHTPQGGGGGLWYESGTHTAKAFSKGGMNGQEDAGEHLNAPEPLTATVAHGELLGFVFGAAIAALVNVQCGREVDGEGPGLFVGFYRHSLCSWR